MNFTIQSEQANGFDLLRLTDHVHMNDVAILPEFGCMLHEWNIETPQGKLNVIDQYADREIALRELGLSYKSAKLSPFACRIPEGKYEWDEKSYSFGQRFIDGSSIHGLLYNKPFKIADQYANDHMALLRLRYHFNREDPGYPFEYACEVIYTLLPDRKLRIETKIENLDAQAIPIADGWHPYFILGGTINDYELQFASETMLEFNEQLIPTGKYVYEPSFRKAMKIGDRFIDNCFILQKSGEEPVCKLKNPESRISIAFFTDSNYPFLQIYTPDHRRSIAIENLSGAPNCFNNGMGLIKLEPQQSQSFQVTYQVGLR